MANILAGLTNSKQGQSQVSHLDIAPSPDSLQHLIPIYEPALPYKAAMKATDSMRLPAIQLMLSLSHSDE